LPGAQRFVGLRQHSTMRGRVGLGHERDAAPVLQRRMQLVQVECLGGRFQRLAVVAVEGVSFLGQQTCADLG